VERAVSCGGLPELAARLHLTLPLTVDDDAAGLQRLLRKHHLFVRAMHKMHLASRSSGALGPTWTPLFGAQERQAKGQPTLAQFGALLIRVAQARYAARCLPSSSLQLQCLVEVMGPLLGPRTAALLPDVAAVEVAASSWARADVQLAFSRRAKPLKALFALYARRRFAYEERVGRGFSDLWSISTWLSMVSTLGFLSRDLPQKRARLMYAQLFLDDGDEKCEVGFGDTELLSYLQWQALLCCLLAWGARNSSGAPGMGMALPAFLDTLLLTALRKHPQPAPIGLGVKPRVWKRRMAIASACGMYRASAQLGVGFCRCGCKEGAHSSALVDVVRAGEAGEAGVETSP